MLLHKNAILSHSYSLITKLVFVRITIALLTTETSCYFVSNEVFATPLTFLFDWYFTFHSIVFFEFINSSIISLMAYQGVSES